MRYVEEEKDENVIKITEDVRIPGTDIILEAGDKITVLPKEETEETEE